jgi:predicted N-acyltransferase
MPPNEKPLQIRLVRSIAEIAPAIWDACAIPRAVDLSGAAAVAADRHARTCSGYPRLAASVEKEDVDGRDEPGHDEPPGDDEPSASKPSGNAGALAPEYNPFVTHAFLLALEKSGSVGGRSGWSPIHLALEDSAGKILGVAPAYVKSHSQGEYVFDHSWADAYERAGGSYYPKLQVAVPFTPVTGPRLLVPAGPDQERRQAALGDGLLAVMKKLETSSAHVTFATEAESAVLAGRGFFARTQQQFHWFNEGYATYDDFLGALASRKRKQLKRERREALANDITVDWITGRDIKEAHWDAFFAFYVDTGSRKWGRPYLNRKFFSLLGEAMADHVLLVMARRGGRYIAGALNLIGSHALFGRYWGALEEHPFLHFEVCYHQAIDFAIAHGLPRVEAGAQGEHKLARGYRPVTTFSAHAFADRGLGRAVERYLEGERAYVEEANEALDAATPFRRGMREEVE